MPSPSTCSPARWRATWHNTTIVRGDAVAEVARLKALAGGDLAIYGHGRLARALFDGGLTDEVRVAIHPVIAGSGEVLFREAAPRRLQLDSVTTSASGVVIAYYRPEPREDADSRLPLSLG